MSTSQRNRNRLTCSYCGRTDDDAPVRLGDVQLLLVSTQKDGRKMCEFCAGHHGRAGQDRGLAQIPAQFVLGVDPVYTAAVSRPDEEA